MPKKRSREEWATLVRSLYSSGLSLEEFAEQEEVKPRALKWWRWKLQSDGEVIGPAEADHATPSSMALSLVALEPVERATASTPVEVVLAGGRIVRVSPGFDPQTLAAVVDVFEQGAWR